MQRSPHSTLFPVLPTPFRFCAKATLQRSLVLALLLGVLRAQDVNSVENASAENASAENASAETAAVKDSFDYEADFIKYLLDEQLFEYANLALSEARRTYPNLSDRIEVVAVSALLRQGKTKQVEEILAKKNLATDMKGQAMLLQLAMTYDAMGNNDAAMQRYQEFLKLNQNNEITDPDVLRYFASAGLRLVLILKDEGHYVEAKKVLDLVIKTSDDKYLKRKFQLMAAQNSLDQALTLKGKERDAALKAVSNYTNDILYGGNDNYFYMAFGIKAWLQFVDNKPEEALKTLNRSKKQAVEMEASLDKEEIEVPKSEYPRAIMRYVEGMIQWDQAKTALKNGDEAGAKKLAVQSAGNLYNTFLRYEGNEYADRAALEFEDLKVWVKDTFGKDISQKDPPQRVLELMFKRELDLAAKLFQEKQPDQAETKLLEGLAKYPDTPYTLTALDTLSKIWISKNEDWELMALTSQVAEVYPDQDPAARIMLRVGKKMADEENFEGVQQVLGDFGRNFPSHPSAPGMLFKIGKAAADRGEQGVAIKIYGDILKLYPQSDFAVRVLQLRAEEALKSENYAEAIKAFEQVRDQARDPMQVAFANLRIADGKLSSKDPELEKQALEELKALRGQLEKPGSIFQEAAHRDQTQEFLQNVRYRMGQVLLREASVENSDALRKQAADELNSYLKEFPETKQAPAVMYNLGRLYLQQGQFDVATKTFETLSEKYPESEAGKDALYSLVKAALEENQIEVAQSAVQKMVAQPESYPIEKINQVAKLMLDNQRWAEARDSYKLVLASEKSQKDVSMRQRALNGLGMAAMGAGGAGDLDQAAEAFETLIKDYPTSTLVMDVGVSLSQLYLQKDPPEPVKAREALGAVSRILVSISNKDEKKLGKAKMDIALGNIYMVEKNPDAALANWYGVGLLEPSSEALGAEVRKAILLALAEAQAQVKAGNANRWNLVIELTDQYLKNFPMDKVANDMRSLNMKAIGLAPKEN